MKARKGKKYSSKADRTEYCKGYVNKNGQWENGFPCPKWGPPDQNYCCGNDDEWYCCPKPSTIESDSPIDFSILTGSVIASGILGLAALILMCLYCRCCWGYKKRKNTFEGPSGGGNPSSTTAISEFSINYSACPHQSYFNDGRNHLPMYPLEDPPPYPGGPVSNNAEEKVNLGLLEMGTSQWPSTSATTMIHNSNEILPMSPSASLIHTSSYGTLNCSLNKLNNTSRNSAKHSLVYENFNTVNTKHEKNRLKSMSPSASLTLRNILTPASTLKNEGISLENLFPRNRLSSEIDFSKYETKNKGNVYEKPSKSLSTISSNPSMISTLPKLYFKSSPQEEDLALQDDLNKTLQALTSQSSYGLNQYLNDSKCNYPNYDKDVWCKRNPHDRNDTDETYFSDTDDKSFQLNKTIGKRLSESHLNDACRKTPSNRHVVKNSKKMSSQIFIDPKQYHLHTDKL